MTHREQINNMSNEELAELLNRETFRGKCKFCTYGSFEKCQDAERICKDEIAKWLNMEVEE